MKKTTKKAFDLKTSYVGTCQACFNAQVIKATGRATVHTMVLHGYVRPGFGYIKGECWGVKHEPYELSCELTKRWKKQCENSLVNRKQYLKDLKAGKILVLYAQVPDRDAAAPGWGMPQPMKLVSLTKGGEYTDPKYRQKWTYESVLKSSIHETERHIEELIKTIDFLGKRIADWVYAPEKLMDHETIKRLEREAKDDNKLAAGFRRMWKDTWERIGRTIREHKDATDRLEQNRGYYKTDAEGLGRVEARWMNETNGRWQPVAWGKLPAFPTNKERKAARDNGKVK